ncbi:MAG: F0F1 ATP synthase subunit A [Magnetococcales bacterium]|nr:F0F1 ATP synthase subunit A [Magnetococcales bacterium]|tara:strand:- start:7663 stop:8409 length:747 start_codon:yes stop_codon:yes gene_type:complete
MANPLEQFVVKPLSETPIIPGTEIMLTNQAVWMFGVTLFLGFFLAFGVRKKALVPGRLQAFIEMTYGLVETLSKDIIGPKGKKMIPTIFALYMFITTLNLAGMIPGSYTATSQIITTAIMALTVFFSVIIIGLLKHGLKFFGLFAPAGVPLPLLFILVPLEIVSFFIRPFTHAVRLAANMMAGHIALKVFASFVLGFMAMEGVASFGAVLPFAGLFGITVLEVVVALLQAYIFTLLTCVYLSDAVNLH